MQIFGIPDVQGVEAAIYRGAFVVTWHTDGPPPNRPGTTWLLSFLIGRQDGSTLQLGAKWIPNAPDSPVVFKNNWSTAQQTNHPHAHAAIGGSASTVSVNFPLEWVDELTDGEYRARGVVNEDGRDVKELRTSFLLDRAD